MFKVDNELTITMDTVSKVIGKFGVEQLDNQGIMENTLYSLLVAGDTNIANNIAKNNKLIVWGKNVRGDYVIEDTITLDNCIEILDRAVKSTGIRLVVLDKVLLRNDINNTKDIVKLVNNIKEWAREEGVTVISILDIILDISSKSYGRSTNSFKYFLNTFLINTIQDFDYTILLDEYNNVLLMNEIK